MNLGKSFKIIAVCIISGLGGFLLVCSCLFLYLSPKLPSIDELKDTRWQIPLRVTSRDLKIISEFGEKKRSPIDFDEIPTLMIVASYLTRFENHQRIWREKKITNRL